MIVGISDDFVLEKHTCEESPEDGLLSWSRKQQLVRLPSVMMGEKTEYFEPPFMRDSPPLSARDLKLPRPHPSTLPGSWLGQEHYSMVEFSKFGKMVSVKTSNIWL